MLNGLSPVARRGRPEAPRRARGGQRRSAAATAAGARGPRDASRLALRRVLAMLLVGGVAALTACGTETSGGAKAGGDTITIAANTPPLSLDPAKNGNTVEMQYFMDLAYEPLIVLEPDGSLAPGLAESWKYLDDEQRVFELTLRGDAKFSDGSPVTAQSVVDSLQHVKDAQGPVGVYVNAIESAKATAPDKVRLRLARTDPTIAFVLTQRFLIGDIVGPKGVENPKVLGTTTQGAGQYMLDPKQTVAGDHYTFVPNPHYYDPDAVHFKKFTIRVIENQQTALTALESGQIAFMTGNPALAPAAESAGLDVTSTLASWYGAFLLDRDGKVAKPLADPKVRQALNYATDREGISKALFGEYGEPNAEPSVPGYEDQGYVAELEDRYPYDPAKAKRLLADAGYPDGFELTLGATAAFGDGVDMAQALANDWSKIGVEVDIKQYQDIAAIIAPWQKLELPVTIGYYDAQPMHIFAGQALAKEAGLFNPWQAEDAELTKLIEAAYAATDADAQSEAWAAVTERVVDLGWFVPVASGATVYFSEKGLKGVEVSPVSFGQNPTLLHY